MDAQRECDAVCKIQSRGKPFAIGKPLAVSTMNFSLFIDVPPALRGYGWRDLPSWAQDRPRGHQGSKPDIIDTPSALLITK